MFLRVVEIAGVIFAFVVIITQLVIPAYRGQKLFPIFRTQGKLEAKLAEVVQEDEEEKVLDEIAKRIAKTTDSNRSKGKKK